MYCDALNLIIVNQREAVDKGVTNVFRVVSRTFAPHRFVSLYGFSNLTTI